MIGKNIDKISFGFYTEQEILDMSEVEINNKIAFTSSETPTSNGLYDPKMGVSPFDRMSKCITCGYQEEQCPGHIGHIKLVMPIFNMLMIKDVHKLLQSKCFNCHRFTIGALKQENFQNLILALNLGQQEIFNFLNEDLAMDNQIQNGKGTKNGKKFSDQIKNQIQSKKKQFLQTLQDQNQHFDLKETSYKKDQKKIYLKQFFNEAKGFKSCPFCNEPKKSIKRESQTRFYIQQKNEEEKTNKWMQMNPVEIKEHIINLFEVENKLLEIFFGKFIQQEKGYKIKPFSANNYFIQNLIVTPNRFRPESILNDQTFLHSHTILYTKILTINEELQEMIQKENQEIEKIFSKWIELQENVNNLFDSSLNQKTNDKTTGIKQILEKKEGIFRMKIMGKRVNYSARSVISPDPTLDTDQVGLPIFMARKLTYPEQVNLQNIEWLKKLIINGASVYPGALFLRDKHKKIQLEGSSLQQRQAIAAKLNENYEQKIVYRHVQNNDIVLFNRQPTLHKPSIMSFKVKVMPKELTIRMHYANCSGFNADFDGDEMNVHVLQNYLARAEGLLLSLSDKQLVLPTNNSPIRGLIQDFVFSCVFISNKEMFFNKSDYNQLLYSSLQNIIEEDTLYSEVNISQPSIYKPCLLWTGKQLFCDILKFVANFNPNNFQENEFELNMTQNTRTNTFYMGETGQEEGQVLIRKNQFIKGLIDKNMIGASSFGLIHSFYELFGSEKTRRLFSATTKLCVEFLKLRGFTCGLKDLILTQEFENWRKEKMENLCQQSVQFQAEFFKEKLNENQNLFEIDNQQNYKERKQHFENDKNLLTKIQNLVLTNENGDSQLDQLVKSSIAQNQSELHKITLQKGLKHFFPKNNFSSMVLTGAKGSILNHSQVSCNLGQQELEGKRPPRMTSGKTLPCWNKFDPNPRCGGFIGDRFLTGLRSQEFFFHCMAGREGLVDTAVKTSRSGYLQRILVKNLESLIVGYDYTVRDVDDQSLVQYKYGEDCLDPTKINLVENLDFFYNNKKNLEQNFDQKKYQKLQNFLTDISDKANKNINEFIDKNQLDQNQAESFKKLFQYKYFEAKVNPGDPVGAVAAQSFGEPSTQMTLNTFHLAGHGGVNVTLGIPRLKELMTSKQTKNPIMIIPFKKNVSIQQKQQFQLSLESISLKDLVKKISYKMKIVLKNEEGILDPSERHIQYKIKINFENFEALMHCFKISKNFLEKLINKKFSDYLQKTLEIKTFEEEHQLVKQKLYVILKLPLAIEQPQIIKKLEETLMKIKIKKVRNILKSNLTNYNDNDIIQTEGINYKYFFKNNKLIDLNKISSNCIFSVLNQYGIEAARNSWIKEINSVFSHYGIKINFRHASLVADHLSFHGYMNPMSRMGLKNQNSPLLKMSFETTMKFLVDAVRGLEEDNLKTASSSLVVGNPIKFGTGSFQIRQKLDIKS